MKIETTNLNPDLIPALCAAIVACDPTRSWHCCCGRALAKEAAHDYLRARCFAPGGGDHGSPSGELQ